MIYIIMDSARIRKTFSLFWLCILTWIQQRIKLIYLILERKYIYYIPITVIYLLLLFIYYLLKLRKLWSFPLPPIWREYAQFSLCYLSIWEWDYFRINQWKINPTVNLFIYILFIIHHFISFHVFWVCVILIWFCL